MKSTKQNNSISESIESISSLKSSKSFVGVNKQFWLTSATLYSFTEKSIDFKSAHSSEILTYNEHFFEVSI